jgi:hypothetical protein
MAYRMPIWMRCWKRLNVSGRNDGLASGVAPCPTIQMQTIETHNEFWREQ